MIFGSTGWAHPVATASEVGPDANGSSTLPQSLTSSTTIIKRKRRFDTALEEYIEDRKQQQEEKARLKQANINRLLELKEQHHKEKMEFLWAIRASLARQNN